MTDKKYVPFLVEYKWIVKSKVENLKCRLLKNWRRFDRRKKKDCIDEYLMKN